MQKFVTIALTAIAACIAASPASAQARKGDKEIQISGNTSSVLTTNSQQTDGQIRIGFGTFVTDRLEIGAAPIITLSKGTGDASSFNADAGVSTFLQYAFGKQSAKTKPYVGANYIINSFKVQENRTLLDNSFVAGAVGVKNYLSERAALDLQGTFGFPARHPSASQRIGFNVGITYLF
jgi:outer membrane protein W